MKIHIPIAAALLLAFSSCGGDKNPAKESQVIEQDPESINPLVTEFITEHLKPADTSKTFYVGGDSITAMPLVKQTYAAHGYKGLWSDKGKLNAAGTTMASIVNDAESFGLIPGDYHKDALDSMLVSVYDATGESYNVNKLSNADILLTDAFFTFAVHVSVGRMANDSAAAREWRLSKLDTNLVALLDNALITGKFRELFESLEPQRREYQAVKRYMNEYREAHAGAKWEYLPDRKTDSAGFFAAIRTRLMQTGDWDSTGTGSDSIRQIKALKKFQERHFLEEDGKIGRNTLLALDMTPEDWTRQMAMNLERWRWEPEKFEKRHMIVNLPAFKMTVWEADTIVMESKIVCGAVKTQTPELDSKMHQVILYPYWNVPYSIAWKEILPHVKRDTGYLRRENYEVLDRNNQIVDPATVNWKKYGRGNLPYKFRQMTGRENALGIMKFDFHNKYSVYMHDTNSKKYFRYTTRAFSHGCMRLEKYMDLAYFLIRDDSVRIPKDTFDLWTKSGDQRKINLRKPLPIHVRYFTCEVDTNGNVSVLLDIYLRDKRMMNVLYGEMDPKAASAPQPAAPATSEKKKSVWVRKEEDCLYT